MSPTIEHLINPHIQALSAKVAGPPKTSDLIRLDKGELPYPPSPRVVAAIAEAAATCNRYPSVLGGQLRTALATYTGARPDQIVITNGSDDLIELILKICLQPGDQVLLPVPTFFIYSHATQVLGGIPIHVQRTPDFGLDLNAIFAQVTPQTKVLFIANPNNPSANLIPREQLVQLLEQLDCLVVVDECYYELSQATVADLIDTYPRLIVLRSFSKSFGLAGLRVGYGLANETLVDYLYRAAQLFPVNKVAIAAALAALQDLPTIHANIEQIRQARTRLQHGLEQLGLIVYPSVTNFLFVNTQPLGLTSAQVVQGLGDRRILVQDFGNKPGLDAYHFRTAVGTASENQGLLAGLRALVGG